MAILANGFYGKHLTSGATISRFHFGWNLFGLTDNWGIGTLTPEPVSIGINNVEVAQIFENYFKLFPPLTLDAGNVFLGSANNNDVAIPATSLITFYFLSLASPRTLSGMSVNGNSPVVGQVLWAYFDLFNATQTITLVHNATSTAGFRIFCPKCFETTSRDIIFTSSSWVRFVYLWDETLADFFWSVEYVSGTIASAPIIAPSKLIFTQTAEASLSNTTTVKSIIGTGVGTLTIPANYMEVGTTIRGRIRGIIGTVSSSTPTLTFSIYIGGSMSAGVLTGGVLVATVAVTFQSSHVASSFSVEFEGSVATAGAGGDIILSGQVLYLNKTSDPIQYAAELKPSPAVTSIDWTYEQLISVVAGWSAAAASNDVQTMNTTLEILTPVSP